MDEVTQKIDALKIPKNISVRKILIYFGTVAPSIEQNKFNDKNIHFEKLMKK